MALNVTGKVVIELLGDTRPDGNREHLGFEIVDVQKYSIPSDTVLDLGARVQPSVEGKPVLDASLKADMRDNGVAAGSPFTLQYTLPGANQLTYFAIKETNNKNDVVAFWMKKSIAGIAWPLYHNRYHLQWPDNSEDYSHYVRPRVTQDNGLVGLSGSLLEEGKQEAKESAVQLPMETTPKLQYQDLDSMGQERAFLSGGDKKFFTLMDTHFPTHRTLLSYETAAGGIAFEHVLSWLDESIKDGQWPNEDQTAHLVEWPKMQVTEAQGVPRQLRGASWCVCSPALSGRRLIFPHLQRIRTSQCIRPRNLPFHILSIQTRTIARCPATMHTIIMALRSLGIFIPVKLAGTGLGLMQMKMASCG